MLSTPNDTIIAVGSPPGRSVRGLVRISGPRSRGVLTALAEFPEGAPSRQAVACRLTLPGVPLPALACYLPGPATFTGQDSAELQAPGNPALLDRLLQHATRHGARLAEPGEFTFRAFLNGKLDLTRAEGVAATIAAASDSQLRAASHLRRGWLAEAAESLVRDVAGALAMTEAGIDFTDQDDVVPIAPRPLLRRVLAARRALRLLLRRSRSWNAIESLPRVVMWGAPSTGKSTLFNAMLGRTRAIVAAEPGTTRDALAEPLTLPRSPGKSGPDVEILLTDLAGLDNPVSALDRAAQAAARDHAAAADLILLIDDAVSATPPPAAPAGVPALSVRTKADLTATRPVPAGALPVSAENGDGLVTLAHAIADRLAARGSHLAQDTLALQPRHESALRAAELCLRDAALLLAPRRRRRQLTQIELIAGCLRASLDELASLGGEMTPDDIIGEVFSRFCIGK